jgi:hypothetical protein
MVAALAVVPVVVTGATLGARWLRGVRPRRAAEMALLLGGLVVVGRAVFAAPGLGLAEIPGAPHTPLTLLPLLLWAAVRLGPAAASLGLLTTALIPPGRPGTAAREDAGGLARRARADGRQAGPADGAPGPGRRTGAARALAGDAPDAQERRWRRSFGCGFPM